ncbi:hypothetical protein, partial [Enterococcus casseliflavus]|uniref:hypothetical protein n=1 Tax=Enterococcus casseliflavus TaxID=37734 RepID=UPI003D12828C
MTAAMLSRMLLYEAGGRDRFHAAWVREINMNALLEPDPAQKNAILSKTIVRAIADRHLAGPAPAQLAAASYAPDDVVRLGVTLSNLNGLDYV